MNKKWVMGSNPISFLKKLKRNIFICVALAVGVLLLNVLCASLRTEENHYLMLLINIVTDILCGGFLIGFCEVVLLRQWRLYRVSSRKAEAICGCVTSVADTAVRYAGLDCVEVVLDGQRRLFLPQGAVSLTAGTEVTLWVAGNTIVGVSE